MYYLLHYENMDHYPRGDLPQNQAMISIWEISDHRYVKSNPIRSSQVTQEQHQLHLTIQRYMQMIQMQELKHKIFISDTQQAAIEAGRYQKSIDKLQEEIQHRMSRLQHAPSAPHITQQ